MQKHDYSSHISEMIILQDPLFLTGHLNTPCSARPNTCHLAFRSKPKTPEMQQAFEVVGNCWLLRSHCWLLYTQSLFLLPDWIASAQNQVMWSMDTWTSPSSTFWKLQGTSWQFCFYRKLSHCSPCTKTTCSHYCTQCLWGLSIACGGSSLGQTRGSALAPIVSAWHQLQWPSGKSPYIKAVSDAFLSVVFIVAIFSHYITICIFDERTTTNSFALIPYIMIIKTSRHKNTIAIDLNPTIMLKCMQLTWGLSLIFTFLALSRPWSWRLNAYPNAVCLQLNFHRTSVMQQ